MKVLFEGGTLYTLIVGGMGIEALVLTLYHQRTGRGVAPGAFLLNLASGMNLMLALLDRVEGRWWGLIALHLLVALVCHVLDLKRLWRR